MTAKDVKHIGVGLYAQLTGPKRYSITAGEPHDPDSYFYGEVRGGITGYALQNVEEELWIAEYLRCAADFLEWLDYHDGECDGFPEPSESWRQAASNGSQPTDACVQENKKKGLA